MNKILVAIRDAKAEYFLPPFFIESKGLAIRAFSDAVNDAQTPISKHPEDYALFHLADFASDTGKITPLDQPLHLCNALEFVHD